MRLEQEMDAAFSLKQAAEFVYRGCVVLTELRPFASVFKQYPSSLNYPEARYRDLFEHFLQSMHSAFSGDHELQAENIRELWNLFISVRDE